ncbi:MAG TPA: hypothetical protein VG960_11015 [Caulobacteraceae bacterium]|nr:hypothetical protein [Caulobacteraceae bacterium]
MPPITPVAPSTAPLAPSRTRSPEAIAAQRAFFNAVLGKAAPTAPAPAPPRAIAPKAIAEASAPPAPARASAPVPTPQGEGVAPPPNRFARPGSLIDIKV